ncbi:GntR family transcriptional regulator [Virgibacillus kimchii]
MKNYTKSRSNMLLKEIAYVKIKEGILEEYFKPGSLLSERELIDMLEMSKTPIKSALDRLETEGFVTVSSKQGIIVNDLTVEQIVDIYNLRIALETHICNQIYKTITDEQLELLKDNLRETDEIVKKQDIKRFAEVDHNFHLMLCRFSGNNEMHKILLNYNSQLLRITLRHLRRQPNRMLSFKKEHEDIYQKLCQRNVDCVKLMELHLKEAKNTLFL